MADKIYSISRTTNNVADSNNSLTVTSVGRVTRDTQIKQDYFRKDYYLLYLIEGGITLKNDNIETVIGKGQFIVLSPFTRSSYVSNKNKKLDYYFLHFTGKDAQNLIDYTGIELNRIYNIGIHTGIDNYWNRFYREFARNDRYFQQAVAAVLTSSLIVFARLVSGSDIDPLTLSTIVYINNHPNLDLKVSTLAKMENMSESGYRNLFKKITGMSPNQYITKKRMEIASDYLINSQISISDIATNVGYENNYAYFEKVFKKTFGISPGKYRKSIKF